LFGFRFVLIVLFVIRIIARNKPIVKRKIRAVEFIRNGRRFSKSELKEAGIIDIGMAKNKGIPIDILRKTTIAENVEQLKPIAKDILNLGKAAEKRKADNINKIKKILTYLI
jgi:ribosomal protein L13E